MKRRQFLAAAGLGVSAVAVAQTRVLAADEATPDKRSQIFKCEECGAIFEMLEPGHEPITHCNKRMKLMPELTEGELSPKHVPVIEKIPGGYKVKVGAVAHPMTKEHHITWIDLIAGDKTYRAFLEIGKPAEAEFHIDAQNVTARAYCNLHGLWRR